MTPEQINNWLAEFQNQTGACIRWQLFESPYGGGITARNALCNFLADKINGKEEYFEPVERNDEANN